MNKSTRTKKEIIENINVASAHLQKAVNAINAPIWAVNQLRDAAHVLNEIDTAQSLFETIVPTLERLCDEDS